MKTMHWGGGDGSTPASSVDTSTGGAVGGGAMQHIEIQSRIKRILNLEHCRTTKQIGDQHHRDDETSENAARMKATTAITEPGLA